MVFNEVGTVSTNGKNTKKKRRGLYYTPSDVTSILCNWAVKRKTDVVLEPSFGGCGFLQALGRRFRDLGARHPADSIFGCDIDSSAFRHLNAVADLRPVRGHFIKGDFLELNASDFDVPSFDAIVGNPPYVSYHNMFEAQRKVAIKVAKLGDFTLGRTASLWAYFVLHGLSFLKTGGRAAWVLPGSLLHSDYGKQLLHGLAPQFKRVIVISLAQRMFLAEGTDESTEILLCDGWGNGPAKNGVEVRRVGTVKSCQKIVSHSRIRMWRGASLNGRAMFTFLPKTMLSDYYELLGHSDVRTLGEMAKVLIGIVTGANNFFILNREQVAANDLQPRQLSLILSKFRFAPGLILKRNDLIEAYKRDERCLLVNRRSLERSAIAIRKYLKTFSLGLRAQNATFEKRDIWHCPDDGSIPGGFLPYMNHIGPRIVLNAAGVNSTNTIHRLYFKPSVTAAMQKLASISMLTTFSQLSAEIEGRTYGSGVLKHEPSEAAKIRLFMPGNRTTSAINDCLSRVDRLIRGKSFDAARREADTLVFGKAFMSKNKSMFEGLRRALDAARTRRY